MQFTAQGNAIPIKSSRSVIDDDVLCDVSSEMWKLIRESHEYLTEIGKSGARKLIRDELRRLKNQVREDVAWGRQQKQLTLTKWGVIIGWGF